MDTSDPDIAALLEGFAPANEPDVNNADDFVIPPKPAEEKTDDAPQRIDLSNYVPRSEVDQLKAELAKVQQKLGERAADSYQPNNAPRSDTVPAPAPAFDVERFNQEFLSNPAAALANFANVIKQSVREEARSDRSGSEAVLARTIINNARQRFIDDNPELAKVVIADIDEIVKKESPASLAQRLAAGTLEADYQTALDAAIGRKMAQIYKSSSSRRKTVETQSAPPPIGGSNVTSLETARGVRMSDLTEAEKEAVKQGARYGVTAADILAQRDEEAV